MFAPYVREKKDQVDAVLSAYAPHEDEVETFRSKRNVVTLLREMKRA